MTSEQAKLFFLLSFFTIIQADPSFFHCGQFSFVQTLKLSFDYCLTPVSAEGSPFSTSLSGPITCTILFDNKQFLQEKCVDSVSKAQFQLSYISPITFGIAEQSDSKQTPKGSDIVNFFFKNSLIKES